MKRSDVKTEDILEAIRARRNGDGPTPDIALQDRYPVKLILAKMEQLVDQGVLNYGVSLRTAWIEAEL